MVSRRDFSQLQIKPRHCVWTDEVVYASAVSALRNRRLMYWRRSRMAAWRVSEALSGVDVVVSDSGNQATVITFTARDRDACNSDEQGTSLSKTGRSVYLPRTPSIRLVVDDYQSTSRTEGMCAKVKGFSGKAMVGVKPSTSKVPTASPSASPTEQPSVTPSSKVPQCIAYRAAQRDAIQQGSHSVSSQLRVISAIGMRSRQ